ncbi:MAG: hypothetical protein HWD59_01575 [Coxiellaceae bacterium]|nr:MAG: hypothetical protein HWD59_01575 [Coxiellaceae bacterium]
MFADFYYTYLVIPDGFFEEELGLTFQDQAGEIDDYSEDSTNRSLDIYKILNSEIKCWRKIATHNTVVNKKLLSLTGVSVLVY